MNEWSRRVFLAGLPAVAGVGVAGAPLDAAGTTTDAGAFSAPVTVFPDDVRYADLVRGNNHRFVGAPDYVRVVRSTEDVVDTVEEAVRAGHHIAVRGGGHCAEDFVANPSVRVLTDLSQLADIYHDAAHQAFAIGGGATLDQVYRTLFKQWGVTIPGGSAPTVGVGGHLCGGGYGALSRRHGSVVDYIYGVEVITVDRSGHARLVLATRESSDPNRDLWWAHTGGGGGNFGVVTKYLMRSPGATGADPGVLLPQPPSGVLVNTVVWPWEKVDERSFTRILSNHGRWHERNSGPDSAYADLYSVLAATHRSAGALALFIQVAGSDQRALRLHDDYVAAVCEGVDVAPLPSEPASLPWLHATVWPSDRDGGDLRTRRYKIKAAYLRKSFTARQIAVAYHHLTRADYDNPQGVMLLIGYGGQVAAVPSAATALAQRDSVLKVAYETFWSDPDQDAKNLDWLRTFYRDVYVDTGGVPLPGPVNDGSYINYPDNDLADPQWNRSGMPWSTLYYKDNYPRLQRIKARWDPRDVFHHTLSIEPAPPAR